MPYENEHSCRVNDPKKYQRMRRTKDAFAPGIDVIYGVIDTADGEDTEVQALRFSTKKFTEAAARKWCADHDFKCTLFEAASEGGEAAKHAIDGKTYDIEEQEIFETGTWTPCEGKKRTYKESDLEEMARAARELGDHLRIPIKLGHNDQQLALFVDGMPAAGWVRNLRVKGSKLVADLCDIPRKVFDVIQNGGYVTKSLEIWHDYKDEATGKTFKHAPCGLALLGAELPALSGLNALSELYSKFSKNSLQSATFYIRENDTDRKEKSDHNRGQDQDKNEDHQYDGGDIQMEEKIKELEEKLAAALAENEKLKAEMKKSADDHAAAAEKAKAEAEAAAKADADKSEDTKADDHAKQTEVIASAIADAIKPIAEESKAKDAQISQLRARLDNMAAAEDEAFLDQHAAKFPPVLRDHFKSMFATARAAANDSTGKSTFAVKVGDADLKSLADLRDHIAAMPENPLMSEFGATDPNRKSGADANDMIIAAYCKEHELDVKNAEHYRRAVTELHRAGKIKGGE